MGSSRKLKLTTLEMILFFDLEHKKQMAEINRLLAFLLEKGVIPKCRLN